MSCRVAALLACSVWTLCVVLAAIAVLLALLTPPGPAKSNSNWGVFVSASLLVYPTVGAFLASRRPENLIGWLLCAIGLLFVTEGFALVYAGYALSVEPDSLSGKQIGLWVSGWFYYPMVFVGAVLLILLFPDGDLPDRSWRVVPWLAAGGGLLWTLFLATTRPVRPGFTSTFYPHFRPFAVRGVMGDFIDMLGRLGQATLLVMCVASVIGVFVRLGSARGDERQQIKWFAYAAVLLLGAPFVAAPPRFNSARSDGIAMGSRVRHTNLGRHSRDAGSYRDSHPQVPPLRHRPHHQPHPRLRSPYGTAGSGLLRHHNGAPRDQQPCIPGSLPRLPRPGVSTRHRSRDPRDGCLVEPLETSPPVLHR